MTAAVKKINNKKKNHTPKNGYASSNKGVQGQAWEERVFGAGVAMLCSLPEIIFYAVNANGGAVMIKDSFSLFNILFSPCGQISLVLF